MRAVVGGLIGGVLGAVLWAGVVVFTGYEVGWIAWAVGGLVGFGVAKGNEDGRRSSTAAGALAIAITAVAIVGGKYAGIVALMPSDDEIEDMVLSNFEREEYLVSYVADDVAAEWTSNGRELAWPAASDPSQASAEADYPPDVWAEAEARWGARSEEDRLAYREAREAETLENLRTSMPEIRTALAGGGLLGSFTPMDVIFFGLAMVTAFGVGSGAKQTAERLAGEWAEAVQLAMLRVMLADGDVDEEEIRTICRVHEEVTGEEVTPDVVRARATIAQSENVDLQAALRGLAPHLTDEAKGAVLRAAVAVAAADGEVEATEKVVISEIATALGLGEEELRAAVAQLAQPA